jgi:undecaprenyl-diphosphatase
MLEFLQKIDEWLLLIINGSNSLFFDNLMYWISGTKSWLPLYLVFLLLIIWYKRKKSLIIIPLIILLITLADQSSVHLFKEVFERLRPCHNPELQEYIHLVKGHCGGKYGFISSHAANTFALAVFLKSIYRIRWLSVLLLSWATIVSYSRIYIGVHYPFDVIAGAVWGALLGYGIYRLYLLLESKLWKS